MIERLKTTWLIVALLVGGMAAFSLLPANQEQSAAVLGISSAATFDSDIMSVGAE